MSKGGVDVQLKIDEDTHAAFLRARGPFRLYAVAAGEG